VRVVNASFRIRCGDRYTDKILEKGCLYEAMVIGVRPLEGVAIAGRGVGSATTSTLHFL
jgi:hypothetical protein